MPKFTVWRVQVEGFRGLRSMFKSISLRVLGIKGLGFRCVGVLGFSPNPKTLNLRVRAYG